MANYAIKKITYTLNERFNSGVVPGTMTPASSNLVAWWRLNTDISAAGNAADSSGNGHDLSPPSDPGDRLSFDIGITPSTIIQTDSCLFDGTKVVEATDSGSFTFGNGTVDTPFSVSAWVKITDLSNTNIIISKTSPSTTGEWSIGVTSTGTVSVSLIDGTWSKNASHYTSTNDITLGIWYHIVVTYNGLAAAAASTSNDNGISIYINGYKKVGTYSTSATYVAMENTAHNVAVGNFDTETALRAMYGNLADISIWNKELTSSEVLALYNVITTGPYLITRNFDMRGSTASQTGSLDQLRQGVSVRTMEQKFGGVIPRFSAGSPPDILVNGKVFKGENRFFDDSVEFPEVTRKSASGASVISTPINDTAFNRIGFAPNHRMIRRDFGQPKLFKDDEPFEDMPKWNPVQFMEDDGCSMIYPYILANVSMRDPDQMDGVIEPLAIRSRASRNSIDWPYEAHSVKGFLLNGAEDSRGNSIPIKQQIDLGPQSFEPFDDGGFEFFGHGQYQKLNKDNETVYYDGSVKWQGYLHDQPEVISPYVDATDRALAFEPLNSPLNIEIFNVVTSITGSIDDINDRGHKSATAGFIYFGAEDGTDSLAFGGLKK